MRGVIKKLPGTGKVDVQPDNAEITVAYDPDKITVDQLLEGMLMGGQPAKRH